MVKLISRLILLIIILVSASLAHAHKATERYIPIGKSPGVSYKYTMVGEIVVVQVDTQTITMESDGKQYKVNSNANTKVWLDKSKIKQSSSPGTFNDLMKGLKAEVKYEDLGKQGVVQWIKIEIDK